MTVNPIKYSENQYSQCNAKDIKAQHIKIQKWFKCNADITAHTPYYKVMHPDHILPSINVPLELHENCSDLIIIAMGGASLIAQIICNLANSKIKCHFLNSTDPNEYDRLLARVALKSTNVIIISNSGHTAETIALTKEITQRFLALSLPVKQHMLCITDPLSTLGLIATKHHIPIIKHDTQINGRFSIFTNITHIIGQILNLDIENFFQGGRDCLQHFWREKHQSQPVQSAITKSLNKQCFVINLSYHQALIPVLNWHSQNIIESLAHNEQKWFAISSLCPQAQHGVFQSYLAGKGDKIYNIFDIENINREHPLSIVHQTNAEESYAALNNAQRPVRRITTQAISAYNIGYLISHLMLETILLGELLEIHPLTQPEIDRLKCNIAQKHS